MKIGIRHIGAFGNHPAKIIELTVVTDSGEEITETISNFNTGLVDPNFITDLRNLAEELESHNYKALYKPIQK